MVTASPPSRATANRVNIRSPIRQRERKAGPMKVIITGSRGITDFSLVETAMQRSGLEGKITQVALRGTSGIARLGEQYADQHDIPLRRFDPIWNPGGRRDNRAELTRDDNL